VTYDGCIRKHERSENFHTMNERVARELIRAFQENSKQANSKRGRYVKAITVEVIG